MKQDLHFALRMIRSHPWFSVAVVATLALGIGINTTVFTLVNAVLFKPVPLPGGSQLVVLSSQNLNETNSRFGVSYPDLADLREQTSTLSGIEAANTGRTVISEAGNPPAEYRIGRVTWRLFGMLQTPPVLGRGFTEDDGKPGRETVALIGYSVWQSRYGGARDVVGRAVRLNSKPATIIGVMPEGFRFPGGEDVWTPLAPADDYLNRSNRRLTAFGRLRPGATIADAGNDLNLAAKRLSTAFPDSNRNIGIMVQTFHEAFNGGQIRTVFLVMLGAVGFVLLIACANVANMMLSRALERRREISVRAALGASRWRLARQLLIECVLLSVTGGLLGLALSLTGVRYFDQATAEVRPYWIRFGMDWVAFAYFLTVSVASGLLFGLFPALRSTRVDLHTELKEGTRTAGSVRSGKLAGVLVAVQFALTVVLLSGAGLMVRSFFEAQALNGFIPAGRIFTARMVLPSAKGERYAERQSRVRFYDELQRRVGVLPGVTHAALTSSLPGAGSGDPRIEIEGRPPVEVARAQRASQVIVSPGYFEAIGLTMVAGRGFNLQDGDAGREAAVATREFATRHWPNEPAIGKRFRNLEDGKPGPWLAIVGVTADMVQNPLSRAAHPLVFLPHRLDARAGMSLVVRAQAEPGAAALANPVRTAVQNLDPDLALFDVMTLPEAFRRQRWFIVVFGTLFSSFAAIGLLIASVGIYAVVAQASERRTREIGIRMALGATAGAIVSIMLARGLRQLGAGLLLGLAGAFAVTRLMQGILVQVSAQDPVVFAGVAILLTAAGLLACWLPARRAAALHPVAALRSE